MNTETITLNMTPREADAVAHVLMAALRQPNFMLDNERTDSTRAANILFDQLDYGYRTNEKGSRVELPISRLNESELYALMKNNTASVARRKEANFELHRRHYPDEKGTVNDA